MVHNLDDIDRGILHVLQRNARNATAAEMGDVVDVSASTVRITDAIHDIGLSIESSEIIRQHRVQPFNHLFFTNPYDTEQEDQNE